MNFSYHQSLFVSAFSILLVFGLSTTVLLQSRGEDDRKNDYSNIKFVIVRDPIQAEKIQEVEIFMRSEDFNERNLKVLFNFLSTKYSEPEFLYVDVKTDWSQLSSPLVSGRGAGGISNIEVEKNDFNRAYYFRRGSNIYFYYSAELGSSKMNKVVLAGSWQPRQRWEN